MGTFKATIDVGDPEGGHFRQVEATVDTGATYTMVPASLLKELTVPVLERRSFELADGRVADYDIGETKIRIDGRTVTSLVVFGDGGAAPVLGAYALGGLGLTVDPVRRRLVPARGLLL
jgi:clan AA aspartic protease